MNLITLAIRGADEQLARSDLHAERRCHGLSCAVAYMVSGTSSINCMGHQSCDTPIKGIHDQSYKTLINFYDLNGKQTGKVFFTSKHFT